VKETWREGSLAEDPEEYVKNTLKTGISFQRGPVWGKLEKGSSTGDFERWMKGALGMESLSLKRLGGGVLGGSSFTGDPGRYVRKASGYGHLSPCGPLSSRREPGMWGWRARIPGTLIDE
jgi:hypothetical protein